MESFKEKKSIKNILVWIIILWSIIILLIVSCNNYIIKENKESMLSVIKSMTQETSKVVNKEINTTINNLSLTANYLTDEELANPQIAVKRFSDLVENNNFKKMSITLPDGTAYIHTGEVVNVADREYFQQSMEGKTYISNLVESKLDLRKANVYSVPIVRDGEVVGVLWASIFTEDFYRNFYLGNISQFGDVFLIDKLGNLIAQEDTSLIDYNFFDLINETGGKNQKQLKQMKEDFDNLEDNYQLFEYRDDASYIYYSKLDYSDWWILTKVSTEKINMMNRSVLMITIGVSSALILVSSIGFILFFLTTKKSNNQLKSIAYTDSATGGKNDIFLKTNIKKIINKKGNFAFISLEIINIKSIINILGVKNAQLLLKEVYDLISKMLKEEEVVVHSYLGEYKMILKYDDITELIERLDQVYYYDKVKNVDVKLGVYLIDKSDINFEDMCSYVNIAKESLTNDHRYAFYTKSIHKKEINKIKLEEDIKHGILNKEFKAWFQPKYGKDGKTLLGAEALVRWHKYGSIISPYIFIPICEINGLIKEIDELILEDVCQNLRIWINKNKKVVPVSINLSRNYLDKMDCVDRLEKIINKYDIPKSLVEFEITESSLSGNEEKFKEIIDSLHDRGFKVLLDDFGVGYSSIKTISDIHFDTLKIDKSFVDGIGNERWESIIEYTIHLARKLDMTIIAEGIETEEQYQFLLNCNCEVFQGYYFNKPMNLNDFSKLL